MRFLSSLFIFILLSAQTSLSEAYTLTQYFNTAHYSINEVILDEGEVLNEEVKKSIITRVTAKAEGTKYQTVTAVFPFMAAGLKGTVNQKLEGLLTITNYGKGQDQISFSTQNLYATNVGIFLNRELLVQIVNNRVIGSLTKELATLPLIFTDMIVEQNTVDFRGTRFYTFKDRAYVIDAAVIDSLFYSTAQRAAVKPGCKITFMAMPDRASTDVPVFLGVHATINAIKCADVKTEKNDVR